MFKLKGTSQSEFGVKIPGRKENLSIDIYLAVEKYSFKSINETATQTFLEMHELHGNTTGPMLSL